MKDYVFTPTTAAFTHSRAGVMLHFLCELHELAQSMQRLGAMMTSGTFRVTPGRLILEWAFPGDEGARTVPHSLGRKSISEETMQFYTDAYRLVELHNNMLAGHDIRFYQMTIDFKESAVFIDMFVPHHWVKLYKFREGAASSPRAAIISFIQELNGGHVPWEPPGT
jgi:hypothetical protein